MRVAYFGTYERAYPRNAQVITCLRRAGVEVDEYHARVWEQHNWNAGVRTAVRLAAAELRLARRRVDADIVLVGYPGHADLPAARRVARGRPIVFNPLVSLHETLVEDRRRFRPRSLAARALATLDRLALRAADLVVADTEANADHLARLASLPRERVAVCFVGAEERLFQPAQAEAGEPAADVLFVGKLIPLHGLETILAAAALAPELRFRVVGTGQMEALLDTPPPNVQHVRWVPYDRLPDELRAARIVLGIFGTSAKAARVIPNKAFHALASAKPLVTADTPAARELLVGGESALLVPAGDPRALASALRRLAADEKLRDRIAGGGLTAYRAHASEEVLGRRWRELLEHVR